ncbi:nucleotide triphosphate diphosphatase NUDT15 [[Actinomadura] parvosata]|uniref:nucleotide triphosphate diphosphatase NUDT15 n=1 Tax=[Actinomadura] parvosata TaxID=1955412 RepID=UPI00406D299D
MPENLVVRVGVQAIVRSGDEVLLGLRHNTFGHGTWGLPGGLIETGETLLEASARELAEETGIRALRMRLACVTDPDARANYHMQIGLEVLEYEGQPRVLEPHRCTRWAFWPVTALPEPLFVGSHHVLARVQSGDLYAHDALGMLSRSRRLRL